VLAPPVFNAAMIYMKDEDLAREIVQVTFIRFWEKRHSVAEIQSLEALKFQSGVR
jgi:DNA-directed RNA polymerase specialized sigma24 family protein